jgi:flagellar biogenesis protein FliO
MKKRSIQCAVLVSSFCILNSAFAEGTSATAPALPDASASLIRVMGSLAVVLGIFLGGVWIFKNWRRITMPGARQPKLKVFESRSLGARQAVVVVGYEKQRFLISTSPNGVNLLTHLPDAADSDSEPSEKPSGPMPFAQALAEVLKKK